MPTKSQEIERMTMIGLRLAWADWMHAKIEEEVEALRCEMAASRRERKESSAPESVRVALDALAIEAPAPAQKRPYTKRKKTVEAVDVTKLHPRDSRSPRHEEWREMMRQVQKKRYAEMSNYARKKMQTAMRNGRSAQAERERAR